jgi:2-methylcitrate dehydratase PrpD
LPRNGLSGKFSGPYAVVGALTAGAINLKSFDDRAVLRPLVQAALPLVEIVEGDVGPVHGSDVGSAPVTVTLFYREGRPFTASISRSPGSPEDPLTEADLLMKWRDCLSRGLPGLDAAHIDALYESGLRLDTHPDAGRWLQGLSAHRSGR